MNWKKTLKYLGTGLLITTMIGMMYVKNEGERMYGAHTQRVDHTQFKPQSGNFIISNVNVLSPDGKSFRQNQSVILNQDSICYIGDQVPDNITADIIDGKGKYLIPGLIDAHVHLFKSPNDLLLYIANGVTQIRELIGEKDHLKWRSEINEGRIGPSMFVASPRLGSFSPVMGHMMEMSQGFKNIPDAEEAVQIVKDLHQQGYDGLKIYSHLNKESYIAVAKTAQSLDMPIFGHIPFDVAFDDIWQNGQSGIAHFEEIMNALQREFGKYDGDEIEKMFGSFKNKEKAFMAYVDDRSAAVADSINKYNISVTSTLWLTQSFLQQKVSLDSILAAIELEYENPGISEGSKLINRALGWLPNVNRYRFYEGMSDEQKAGNIKYWQSYGDACQLLAKNLSKNGVKIMAGTDANLSPTVPGFSLHDELISLHAAGISNSDVLQTATTNPANWLKTNTGKIETGYKANLVLLERNPLEDIQNTKSINTVFSEGRMFDRDILDDMLQAVKAANDQSRKIEISQYTPRSNQIAAMENLKND